MAIEDSFEEELDKLFSKDKFGSDSKADVENLEKLLAVDKEHIDLNMTNEYLEKLLSVEKYKDSSEN